MHTPQEAAWRGEFGDQYTDRNMGKTPANRAFFRRVFATPPVTTRHYAGVRPESVLELGCGSGENLLALRQLMPQAHLAGVEINAKAAQQARMRTACPIHEHSLIDFNAPAGSWDMVLVKGVLIHIPPTELERAYEVIVRTASRWVLIAEYYNPTPVEVRYRDREAMLWKRDFAGELLNRYQELELHSYGFAYHRDPYPQDDLSWFLLEKRLENPDAGVR